MTAEEIKAVEALVNEKIKENIPVEMKEISLEEAKAEGFTGLFESKYGERVKTYSIGDFSREIWRRAACGGDGRVGRVPDCQRAEFGRGNPAYQGGVGTRITAARRRRPTGEAAINSVLRAKSGRAALFELPT